MPARSESAARAPPLMRDPTKHGAPRMCDAFGRGVLLGVPLGAALTLLAIGTTTWAPTPTPVGAAPPRRLGEAEWLQQRCAPPPPPCAGLGHYRPRGVATGVAAADDPDAPSAARIAAYTRAFDAGGLGLLSRAEWEGGQSEAAAVRAAAAGARASGRGRGARTSAPPCANTTAAARGGGGRTAELFDFDRARYDAHAADPSGLVPPSAQTLPMLRAHVRRWQHDVEKGLSMPRMRPGFGVASGALATLHRHARLLLERTAHAPTRAAADADRALLRTVQSALASYAAAHAARGKHVPPKAAKLLRFWEQQELGGPALPYPPNPTLPRHNPHAPAQQQSGGGAPAHTEEGRPTEAAAAAAQPPSFPQGGARRVRREEVLAAVGRREPAPPAAAAAAAGGAGTLGGGRAAGALLPPIAVDLAPFFASRHAVRQFDARAPVEPGLIVEAVRRAVEASPSVCNRQGARVYYLTSARARAAALRQQNGNRGFGHAAPVVLVLAASAEHYMLMPEERYQGWIDGGMFAQSLLLALHSVGLGACPLNWDVSPQRDRDLRREIAIPEGDLITMLVAVGHLPPELDVAVSPRKPLRDVLFPEALVFQAADAEPDEAARLTKPRDRVR